MPPLGRRLNLGSASLQADARALEDTIGRVETCHRSRVMGIGRLNHSRHQGANLVGGHRRPWAANPRHSLRAPGTALLRDTCGTPLQTLTLRVGVPSNSERAHENTERSFQAANRSTVIEPQSGRSISRGFGGNDQGPDAERVPWPGTTSTREGREVRESVLRQVKGPIGTPRGVPSGGIESDYHVNYCRKWANQNSCGHVSYPLLPLVLTPVIETDFDLQVRELDASIPN